MGNLRGNYTGDPVIQPCCIDTSHTVEVLHDKDDSGKLTIT